MMRTSTTFVLLISSGLAMASIAGCGGEETTDIPDTGTPGNDSSVTNDSSRATGARRQA
jgi:hypothetical protein